jgi:hypothetical protein
MAHTQEKPSLAQEEPSLSEFSWIVGRGSFNIIGYIWEPSHVFCLSCGIRYALKYMTCLLAVVFACHSGSDSLKSLCCILVPPRLVEHGQICSGFIKSLTIGTVGTTECGCCLGLRRFSLSHLETHSELRNHDPQITSPLCVCHLLSATLLVSHMLGPLSRITLTYTKDEIEASNNTQNRAMLTVRHESSPSAARRDADGVGQLQNDPTWLLSPE